MPARRHRTESTVDAQLEAYSRDPIPSRQEVLQLGRLVQAWRTALEDGAPSEHPAFQRLARAGLRARDRLVSGNMRLAVTVAKSHQGRGVPLEDLIQEGAIGLTKAAEKFDPTRGYTFSTYAFWWIRQAVLKAVHESGNAIRVPADTGDALARYKRLVSTSQSKLSATEIIETLGLKNEKCLDRILAAAQSRSCRSLSGLISGYEKLTLEEKLACPNQGADAQEEMLEMGLQRERLNSLLEMMPIQQREVIVYRYLMGMTVMEISRAMRLPRNKVTPLAENSLEKLKLLARESFQGVGGALGSSADKQFADLPLFAAAAGDGVRL